MRRYGTRLNNIKVKIKLLKRERVKRFVAAFAQRVLNAAAVARKFLNKKKH